MAEQLLKQRGTKRKTPNFKKSSKTTPEKDMISRKVTNHLNIGKALHFLIGK